MDEQQIIQILNQIPLDVLQNYVAQRTQQEQSAMQQTPQIPQQMPQEQIPEEAMYQQTPMNYGGKLNGWSPYVDMYACGGSTRTAATRGRLGARKGHRR